PTYDDYDTFVPPPKGGSYTDASLGCTVKRLSDGAIDFARQEIRHEYSNLSPFNSNNCRLLVSSPVNGTPKYEFLVIDPNGNIVRTRSELQISEGDPPSWSRSNPNLFYYRAGNAIMSYDVASGSRSQVFIVSDYASVVLSDDSEDGNHFVVGGAPRQARL